MEKISAKHFLFSKKFLSTIKNLIYYFKKQPYARTQIPVIYNPFFNNQQRQQQKNFSFFSISFAR